MRAPLCGVFIVFAALAIAGCRGSAPSALPQVGAGSDAGQADAARRPSVATGTLVIVLPTIVPANPRPTPPPNVPPAQQPALLSSGTTSISGTFGTTALAPVDVSAGSPNCKASAGGGRVCTASFTVPAGTRKLHLSTYGSETRFGMLGMISGTDVRVSPGVQNYPKAFKWFGTAHGVKIYATPKLLTQFKPGDVTLVVYGVDGSGALIPGSRLLATNGAGFGTQTTATGAYNQSLDVPNFYATTWSYDGRRSGAESFKTVATAHGVTVATDTKTVHIQPANSKTIGQVIAASTQFAGSNPFSLVEFAESASGNVAPLRTLRNNYAPYGAQDDGSFWASTTRYDTIGDVLGTISPSSPGNGYSATAATVDAAQNEYVAYYPYREIGSCIGSDNIWVFAANSYGKTNTRKLVGTDGCAINDLAVDGTGVLYAFVPSGGSGPSAKGSVLEYAPNTTGNVPPVRTIANVTLKNLVGDAAGNLWAIQNANVTTGVGSLVEYLAGSTTATPVLQGVGIAAFALDGEGNIYAEVPTTTSPPAFQVEEFQGGASTPTRIIGGSLTGLTIPQGIAVIP